MATPIPPVRKELLVAWDPERAFHRFTGEIGAWWPLRSHSVGQADAEMVVMEPRPGGRILEKIRGGRESVWGTVREWEPPHRVSFTWHPGRPANTAGLVEMTFTAHSSGTRVTLVHGDWEPFGAKARVARNGYSIGWPGVLALYAGRPNAPAARLNQFLSAIAGLVNRVQRRPPGAAP